LAEEYSEADRLERAAYEKFGSNLRYLHAEERNYDKRMRQWALIGSVALSVLSAAITWFRLRVRAVDPVSMLVKRASVWAQDCMNINRKDNLSLVCGHAQQLNHDFAFGKTRVIGRANEKMVRLVLQSWSSTGTLNRAVYLHPAYQVLRTRLGSVKFENGLESVNKLVSISEEIQKSVNAIPQEVVRICFQSLSFQSRVMVPSPSPASVPLSIPVPSEGWSTKHLLVSAVAGYLLLRFLLG
uniref:Transmembrane protein n=1 Tax=Schistocephalus solidus TaxID=70667 RepID=A0A183TC29_SCHSO